MKRIMEKKFETSRDFNIGKDMSKVFFTSDTHFNHENIIRYCNRPFKSIEEHDETLVKNWNSIVPSDGIVFHLGDVGFGDNKTIKSLLDRLNGEIVLVIGNHDWRYIVKQHKTRFKTMVQQLNLKVGGQHIIMNHYPLLCFAGSWRKQPTWQLFGHVHTSPLSSSGLDFPRLSMLFPSQLDVGVDNHDFKPWSYGEMQEEISRKILLNSCM